MISSWVLNVVRCPDCQGRLESVGPAVLCAGCGRVVAATDGFLDLRPQTTFAEQTKYLDEALHLDARHESIAPPLLGSKIRHDMLRKFLALKPGDRVIDLGCGSGRAMSWSASTGASITGIDISPFFAPEAVSRFDLLLGDLRQLPIKNAMFDKAWSLDVLEHLSPQAFRDVLREANRVLQPDGRLFIYTHVRQNGWPAAGVRLVNRFAGWCERRGLLDLRQERLRKSDHLNPIASHDELARVVEACGFEVERVTYYTPVAGAFVENVLARVAERLLTRRAQQASRSGDGDEMAAARRARASAQARVSRGGMTYHLLRLVSQAMKIDLVLFGRIRSGPFFALLRKSRLTTEDMATRDRTKAGH